MTQTELTDVINGLFGDNEIGNIAACELQEDTLTMSMQVPESLRWFEGHFPEQPVLAGVVQTHWAVEIAQVVFDVTGQFDKINNLKFKAVIMPNIQLTLTLQYMPDKQLVKFNYQDESVVYSQGQIYFATELC